MTTSTVTLVGDVSDLIGNDYDPSRTKVWVQHNTDKVVTDSGPIRLGAATKAVASDGTFSFVNVVASTSLVTNLQATLWVDWPNTAGPERTRRQVSFGPYDLTGLTGTVDIRTLEATQALDPVASSALLSEMQDLRDQVQDISQIAVPDDVITAIDANPASDFRQQQDARQSASIDAAVDPAVAALVQSLTLAGNLPRRMIPSPVLGVGKYLGLFDSATSVTGSGYAVGDIVQINGGPGLVVVPTQLKVTAIDGVPGSNAITGTTVYRRGVYASPGGAIVLNGLTSTTISGTGTGAQFNTDWRPSNPSGIAGASTLVGPTDVRIRHTGRASVNIGGSGYYGDNMGTAWRCSYEWATDDPTPEIKLIGVNTNVQLFIDGAQSSAFDITTDNTGQPYLLVLNLGTKVMRDFRLVGVNQGFGGVQIASTSTFSAPTVTRPLTVAFGDSYSVGNGAENASSQALQVMCDLLGWDLIIRGTGGTGWTSGGADLPETRVTEGLNMDRLPNNIIWDLGFNDAPAMPDAGGYLISNLNAAVDKAQTLAPAARQIAFGPATPAGPTTNLAIVRNYVKAAMETQGVTFVDAGWVTAATAFLYTGTDGVHPTPLGHKFIGVHKALAVSA